MKKSFKFWFTIIMTSLTLVLVEYLPNHNSINEVHARAEKASLQNPVRTVPLAKFNKIDINVAATDVHIHTGDRYQVKITDNKYATISAENNQGTLKIRDHGQGRPFGKRGWANRHCALAIDITVPDKDSLIAITSKNNAGNFKVENLQLRKLAIDTDAGDCKLLNMQIKRQGRVSTNDGDIKISSSQLNNLNFKSKDGNITINHSKLAGSNLVKINLGNFTMHQASRKINYRLATRGKLKLFDHKKDGDCLKKVHLTEAAPCNKNTLKVTASYGNVGIN
ncbi:DUF4097 family beta strand repeat-containing protein [Lactobacillus sp. ESL0791]|uniref:DUF4097 family beta strand repeat-containing protein n=1 Tax=Lactobacillus sp. ESL0791 TaxID=2983234 RepID=UPI0023F8E7C4|nr:DUF4097 family beta strand repeat-containing protein [Lactobacillus sp. ESL0791]MDF7637965.1 DUF4097 family beta strand repeat-containing protein [Lactobacillus sp. ESL0791]